MVVVINTPISSGSTKTAEGKGEMAIGLFHITIYVVHTEYGTGLTNDSSILNWQGKGDLFKYDIHDKWL